MNADTIDELLEPIRWTSDRCHVGQALEEVPVDRQVQVTAAARNERVSVANVRAVLVKLIGQAPSLSTMRRHRAGECACP